MRVPGGPDSSVQVDLTVVMPMRNAAATVGLQLDALRQQEWKGSWEVIVADNGSADEGPTIVRRLTDVDTRFRLIDAAHVHGPAATRNLAVQGANGWCLAFCDADDVVGESWVEAMGSALRCSSAVTGPQEQAVLNTQELIDVHGSAPATRLQYFEGLFPFAPSSNFGITRDVFEDLGGFDPSIRVGEDIDLSLRLWVAGHDLRFERRAVVHYRNRDSARALFRQAVQYGAAAPMIARRAAEAGLPRPNRIRGLRNWLWLIRHMANLTSRPGRARWVAVAGRALGRVIGTLRHRTLFL